jgi:hypothetical protein
MISLNLFVLSFCLALIARHNWDMFVSSEYITWGVVGVGLCVLLSAASCIWALIFTISEACGSTIPDENLPKASIFSGIVSMTVAVSWLIVSVSSLFSDTPSSSGFWFRWFCPVVLMFFSWANIITYSNPEKTNG